MRGAAPRRYGGRGIELNPLPFGNYFLLERLAVGGMAEVYLAKCFGVAGFERLVALKRILPNIAEDDEFIAMFIDEAKIAGQLSHANVAQIFDLGKINNSYFIAMEYISGHDLRALWDRSRESGGIPLALACYVVQRLCEGLDYAHRRRDNRGRPLGIIHRDVSPQNVLLSYDGDIKVIDFGIAKAANRMVRTQTGILKGKFAYMAPEQARGEPIDHRADIFAIGVMLYELVTGERAFKAESDFALLEKVRRVDIVPPRKLRAEVPRDLERIIYKAMSKDAKDRYAWASAMRADLDRFMVDHDLSYNKEELGAYVRRSFKSEHDEEQRRLKLYQTYKPAGVADAGDEDDDEPSDLTPRPDPAGAEHATVVRSDLSSEAEPPTAGTEVAPDASTRQPVAPEHTRPEPPSPGAPLSDVAGVDPDTSKDLRHGESRARRIVSSGDILPWEEERRPPPPPGQTMVDVSRPAFSEAGEPGDDDGEDAIDETMVDNNPVSDASSDAPSALPPPVERRKEGTRPDVRGSSLGQVLGTSPALLPLERERARRLESGGDDLRVPSNGALGGSRYPPPPPASTTKNQARIETEHFREPARSDVQRGVPRSTVTAVVAAVALVAVVVGLATGFWLGERLQTASTFVVVTPGPALVQLGGETLCATTPCAVSLPPGKHDLMFVKDGLGAVSKTIEVGGGTTVVDVRLQPRLAGLRLVTTPPGAQVWLDGDKLEGVTPLALPELTAGDKVKLKMALSDEYDVLEELFEVRDTKGAPLSFELPARETEWRIRAEPEDAVVLIDDERPRVGRAKLVVKRGQGRIVSVQRPGCETKRMTLLGNGKREAEVPVALSCRAFDARITITGTRGAEVEVDGVPLARRVPVRELPVPAGEHLVVARRRGRHLPFVVEVEPGQTATVNAKMR